MLCSLSGFGQFEIHRNGDAHLGPQSYPLTKPNPKLYLGGEYVKYEGMTNAVTIPAPWYIQVMQSSGDLHISQPYVNSNYATTGFVLTLPQVYRSAQVGICRTPSYTLDVNGQIRAGSQVLNSSDERFKTQIQKISYDKSSLIYNLSPKSYYKSTYNYTLNDEQKSVMKEEKEKTFEYGFIAQELKEVFPELVFEDDEGYFSINYIGLIPIMIDVLKEQKKQLDEQNQIINELAKLFKNNSFRNAENQIEGNSILNLPKTAELKQNIPNPFNTETLIEFYIPENTVQANLYIYDMNGMQKKKINVSQRGNGNITIKGYELQAGMYLYSLVCDNNIIDTKQMILTD